MSTSEAVLLVGGAGFIGQALAGRLASQGREVHILSRRMVADLPVGVIAHQGDQGDIRVVEPLMARCSEVFHLAAATTPVDTMWKPSVEAELGLIPALRFLECAQHFPDNRYFLMSTGGALYGNAEFAAEISPLSPLSYHGAGKLALESFFGVLGQRCRGSLSILRPSNVYGPGQILRPGFGAVRTLLERARDGGGITVYGDGNAVRDYLYIDDLVNACLCALNGPAGIYNIGAGVATSLNTLLAVIKRVTGRSLTVEFLPARPSDVGRIVLDIRRAGDYLGWKPDVCLEDGIDRTWKSLR